MGKRDASPGGKCDNFWNIRAVGRQVALEDDATESLAAVYLIRIQMQ